MKELRTEIEIQAAPDKVWQILTDFEKYPEWNPFILKAIGKAKGGEKVDLTFESGTKTILLHSTVIKAESNKVLCWKYHVVLPFLFCGEHSFVIEQIEKNGIRLINQEIFTGLLVATQSNDINTNTKQGFIAMDRALKARAEKK